MRAPCFCLFLRNPVSNPTESALLFLNTALIPLPFCRYSQPRLDTFHSFLAPDTCLSWTHLPTVATGLALLALLISLAFTFCLLILPFLFRSRITKMKTSFQPFIQLILLLLYNNPLANSPGLNSSSSSPKGTHHQEFQWIYQFFSLTAFHSPKNSLMLNKISSKPSLSPGTICGGKAFWKTRQ